MKGRKPKPSHLRVVEGNPGRRPIKRNEPKAPGALHAAPEWLTPAQKAVWTYAIANAPLNLLRRIDQGALVVWVVAADLHRQASEAVRKHGLLTKSSKQGAPIQNPYLPILNKQAQIMLKAAAEMGFTPSSRSRIEVPGGDPDPEKPGEEEELF